MQSSVCLNTGIGRLISRSNARQARPPLTHLSSMRTSSMWDTLESLTSSITQLYRSHLGSRRTRRGIRPRLCSHSATCAPLSKDYVSLLVAANSCSSLTMLSDNEEAVHDMPINLQLVARRLEEEKVLMMTEVVLEAL